jgi:hypothetical protein
MPTKFMDMRQASIYWNIVMRRAFHFICIAWKLSHSEALGKRFDGEAHHETAILIGTNIHSSPYLVSDDLRQEQAVYAAEISRWSDAFEPLFRMSRATNDRKLWMAATLLRIHSLAARVIIEGVLFTDQMSYDEYLPVFAEILDTIKSATFDPCTKQRCTVWDGRFLLDLGLTSPLCLIVMRCRDRKLRRHAITMLRSLPNEGAWVPKLTAAIGTWMMEVEEDGVMSEVIPERSRAVFTRIRESPEERKALVQCCQRTGAPDGGPRWKEKWASW